MRAARYYGKEDIRVEHVDEPRPRQGQIKVAPAYVGICGTDLHEYIGGPTFVPLPKCPHPITNDSIPITLGHEFSGTVAAVGPGCSDTFKEGQRVVVQPSLYCGSCAACTAGIENVCHSAGFVGLSGGGGGLSDAVCVGERAVLPLPENVGLDVGALVEPLSVAWHAISAAPIKPSDTTLVLGGGPIGLAVLQCLKAKGVKTVIVAEVARQRQESAKEFGADYVLDPTKEDVVALAKKYSGGEKGPDVVFDCAGVPASIKTACNAVKARGWVVNVAIWEKEVPFNPNWLVFKEAKYTAALGYQKKDFEAVLKHLEDGSLKPQRMITRKVKLEKVVEDGVLGLIRDKDNQIKILVDIGAK